jgi:excinuclease UvrABC helicase subunit UvrB
LTLNRPCYLNSWPGSITNYYRGLAGIALLYGLLQLLDYFEDNVVWIVDEHPNSIRV